MPNIADEIHLYQHANLLQYSLMARPSFGSLVSGTNDWGSMKLESFSINESHEHLVSEASFIVSTTELGLDVDSDLTRHVNLFSQVKFSVTMFSASGISVTRQVFSGTVVSIESTGASTKLKCFDPLFQLNEAFLDLGSLEANVVNVEHDSDDVEPGTLPDTGSGVTLVGVTENSEERWIIPWEIDGSTCTNYQDAYYGSSGAATYSGNFGSGFGSGSYTFQAGSNRRTWKMIGRVYDTGMDLNSGYGVDKVYPEPLPEEFYRVGSDTGDYVEFTGYTPVGHVFVEWVSVYEEGTNDIEDVLLHILNPQLTAKCANSSASTTVCNVKGLDLYRDNVLVGATVTNTRLGEDATISSIINRSKFGTTALTTGSWESGDSVVIKDGCGVSPRWRDGVQYELSGGYWGGQTIFESGQTLNRFTWHYENGPLIKAVESVLESCAPNYRVFWDHSVERLRMQFIEQTPFDSAQPYYPNAYGKFIAPPDPDASDAGDDDYHTPDVSTLLVRPDESQGFFTRVVVEGVYEHPKNMIQIGCTPAPSNVQIITTPPGSATGWANNTGSVPTITGNWEFRRTWAEAPHQSYATAYGSGGLIGSVLDSDAGTSFGWYTDLSVGALDEFAPFVVFDAKEIFELGRLKITMPWSKRPFKWNVRLEACTEDGVLWDAVNSQWYVNLDAKWQVLHPECYSRPMGPWEQLDLTSDFLVKNVRYVLVSMTPAKVVDVDWGGVGLAGFQMFKRETVTGQARIADFGGRMRYAQTTSDGGTDTLIDTGASFDGSYVGAEVFNLRTCGIATVLTVDSSSQLTTTDLSYGGYQEGDKYEIRPATSKSGLWRTQSALTRDDGLIELNMPRLHQQVVAHNVETDWGMQSDFLAAGHRSAYYQNRSLSSSDACTLEAQRILAETVRRFRYCGLECKWHLGLGLYKTVELTDPYTGDKIKALVENITYTQDGIKFDATHYSVGAWTRETPEAF